MQYPSRKNIRRIVHGYEKLYKQTKDPVSALNTDDDIFPRILPYRFLSIPDEGGNYSEDRLWALSMAGNKVPVLDKTVLRSARLCTVLRAE